MATPRMLSDAQEREVALTYLCGVDTDKIEERYRISDGTIRNSILRKRSREWNDPLVELYRETDPHRKDRNAVHLYLAIKEVPGLQHGRLVDRQRDQPVYDLVEKALYLPGIKKSSNAQH